MTVGPWLNPLRRTGWWLALGVAAAVELAASFGGFARIETVWDDWRHRLAGVRHWPSHVALVVIDDASLNQYKDDPLAFWTPQMARAVERLRDVGAAVVGIDFMFSVSPEAWLARIMPASAKIARTYDGPLRAAINSGRVVLVASQLFDAKSGYDQFLLPAPSFLMAVPDFDFAAHIGLANLTTDADGVVRHFAIAPGLNLPPGTDAALLPRYGFAPLLAARAAAADPSGATWQLGGVSRQAADQLHPIVYSGPPGTVPRISLSRLLADGAAGDPVVQELRGKAVILGGEFLSMGDTHLTPYGTGWFAGNGAIMTGAEVQANIIETLLAGLAYQPFPAAGRILLVLVFAAAGVLLWPAHGALRIAGLAGMTLLALFGSYVAFVNLRPLPAAGPLAALLLAFGGSALLASSPARRHEARVRAALGPHVGEGDIAWLAASRQPLPLGWEHFPAAVLALVLPPADDAAVFEARLAALGEELRRRGAAVSSGEGQMLFAYFGWPRPSANPCAEALAAARAVAAQWHAQAAGPGFGIGLHTGETAFRFAHGAVLAAGESVAAAAGLAHDAIGRATPLLASRRLLLAAAPGAPPQAGAVVWKSGPVEVAAVEPEAEPVS